MTRKEPLHLFEGYGIELEYMIVDSETLDVRPIADEVLKAVGGGYELEVEVGPIAWSNELVLHVLELKTNGPARELPGLAALFQESLGKVRALLEPMGARLMPTGMHPWMDPHRETRLWPHENDIIYRTYDRIYGCSGHGWSNLQSTHINLPFAGDEEFGRLHAAIRMVLPILPALTASTPIVEGRPTELLDNRLEFYRNNARKLPAPAGRCIPERIFTRASYEGELLQGIYDRMAPHDPEGILRHEWVNSRACIARFDRSAIEIRILDIQENPAADLALAGLVCAAIQRFAAGQPISLDEQMRWSEDELLPHLLMCIRDADGAVIRDARYLKALGFPETKSARAGELWRHLASALFLEGGPPEEWRGPLETVFEHGCLARRIRAESGQAPDRRRLLSIFRELCDCLDEGKPYVPDANR